MQTTPVKYFFACLLVAATAALSAQSTAPAPQSTYYPTKLTLHPSAATQPVSRYRLLPDLVDQTPGNAVTLYLQVRNTFPDQKTTEEILWPENHKFSYDQTPIDRFPRQYAQRLLAAYSEALTFADLAARRQDAVWDTGWRERAFGGLQPFGYMSPLRHLANVLSFRARFQISQRNWDAAHHTLQTEFSMARQAGTQPLAIHALIESGFAEVALSNAVEEWIGHGDSPNLYWELTDLPHPFVELRPVQQWEDLALRYWKPQIWQALHGELPPHQWPQVIREMITMMQEVPSSKHDPAEVEARAKRLVELTYPRAKQHLLSGGTPTENINAMSPEQVVGTYLCDEFNKAADELWRAWTLPYLEAQEQMLRSWHALKPDQPPALDNPLIQAILVLVGNAKVDYASPAVLHMRYQLERPDRQIALLRTVEALRNYAAYHDGQPPDHLEQITDLPLPVDSLTGKPFGYRLEGRAATLDAPAPFGRSPYSGWRYELTFSK